MNDQQARQFLADVRKPLLALHKTILEHERAGYEKEIGAVTPAAFLQALINHPGFRWLGALSTVIANVDEMLDADDATPEERIGAAQSVVALFTQEQPDSAFLSHYRQLLQASPDVLHEHGRVAQVLRQIGA
ncbi:hypothetical protein [Paraburkholderia sp. SOS3]|jgi:hypothetical protein|uniref:hypothetical protein n=1 Tax=Paraburkholderia sp. SOS3 TaxID=1926494 RepID=UPI00094749CD|nr:hypothetical protein [Paraburkholderia sp. SOS3]APR39498.1 hypothetical protein BTO02_30045 [Paraburkholderia sp. SOS3]